MYGTVAYDTKSVPNAGVQTFSWNVLSLVDAWQGGSKNYGFMLREIGNNATTNWSSRFDATVGNRPVLTLTSTSLGVVTIQCGRNTGIANNGSYTPQSGATSFSVSAAPGSACVGLLWFDLSSTPNDITAASLTCKKLAQFGSTSTVGVFAIWNPGDQSTIDTQHIGVASNYLLDANLSSDPAILFSEQFADNNYASRWTAWFGGNLLTTADAFGFTPTPQIPACIGLVINPGDPAGGYLNSAWSPWRSQGLHVKPLAQYDELYQRFYFMLGTDWNPQPTGGKLPGWQWRYNAIAGTGTGIDGMGSGNGGTGCNGYTGGSARFAFGTGPAATDVLQNRSWVGYSDVYNLDQTGDGNINQSFGGGDACARNYLGYLRPGQWYCIEQYVKLNSITVKPQQSIISAVASADGTYATATLAVADTTMINGDFKWISGANEIAFNSIQRGTNQPYGAGRITVVDTTHFIYELNNNVTPNTVATGTIVAQANVANSDGITKVWINGRLAEQKTDWRFRSTLTCTDGTTHYGVDATWWNVYFGGTQDVITGGHMYFANAAVGTSYIGPMTIATGALPAWLQGKQLNTWIQIPNSGIGVADSPQMIGDLAVAGLCTAQGGATGWGQMPAGITQYSGGALVKATSEFLITGGGGAGSWAGNDVRGLTLSEDAPSWHLAVPSNPTSQLPTSGSLEYLPDGVTHNTGHSLFSPQFLDSQNRFYHITNSSTWPGDAGNYAGVDSVDFAVTRTSRHWAPKGTNPRFPVEGLGQQYLWICKDPATDIIYAGASSGVYKFTPSGSSGTWSGVWSSSTNDGVAAIGLGVILNIGHNSYPATYSINLATGIATKVTLLNMPPFITMRAAGFVFDPGLGAWLLFIDDGKLYKIVRTNATTFTCSDLGVTGAIATMGGHGIYSRMQYVPNLKGVVILPDGLSRTYFVRTT
jgi:hypothetical protein